MAEMTYNIHGNTITVYPDGESWVELAVLPADDKTAIKKARQIIDYMINENFTTGKAVKYINVVGITIK